MNRIGKTTILVVLAAVFAAGAIIVWAAAGTEIDMTIADNEVAYNDAIFIQGPIDLNSAGTGVIGVPTGCWHPAINTDGTRRDGAEVVELLEGAVDVYPDNFALRTNLGYHLQAAGRLDDAMRASPEANRLFIDLLLKHGNPERALRRMNCLSRWAPGSGCK